MAVLTLLEKIQLISCWRRGEQRAPHKPLMLLHTLSLYKDGHQRLLNFEKDVDQQIKDLLAQYGPPRAAYRAEYPFWRLANEKNPFWEIVNGEKCTTKTISANPKKSELIKYNVMAGFDENSFKVLQSNPALIDEIAAKLIQDNFPETLQNELFTRLGFDMGLLTKVRDPGFRRKVLRAYNFKCAVCGFDLAMDTIPIALEAAHIKWKQYNGPCEVPNGIALCSIHHKAFDRGAIALDSDFKINVSSMVKGGELVERLIWDFQGKSIKLPREALYYPSAKMIEWHVREVFKT